MSVVITEPGIYDLSERDYHQDPVPGGSLSASGSKLLLPPNAPALYKYQREHGSEPKDVFDLGTATHAAFLGVGAGTIVVDETSWQTKAAKEAKAQARAEGKTPLLAADAARVDAMVEALRAHPLVADLFRDGAAEQAMVWRDEEFGIWCRALVDYRRGRLISDLKTCISAHPSAIAKAVVNYSYDLSAAHYIDGARTLGLDPEPAFLLAFVEKTPPHLITVVELDSEALDRGWRRCQQARAIYADCVARDEWPGHTAPDDIPVISLPAWALREDSAA